MVIAGIRMGRPAGKCKKGLHDLDGNTRCTQCKTLRDLEQFALHMWADWALVKELLAVDTVPFRLPTRMEICIAVREKRPFYDIREQFLADRLGVSRSTINDALRWASENGVSIPSLQELIAMTYPAGR